LAALPALPGALECIAAGHLSSLHAHNARALAAVADGEALRADARWPLLADPQTAGGLLAGMPEAAAAACVERLRAAGYGAAAVIGRVIERGGCEALAVGKAESGESLLFTIDVPL
jgi:selenide,water dikinase